MEAEKKRDLLRQSANCQVAKTIEQKGPLMSYYCACLENLCICSHLLFSKTALSLDLLESIESQETNDGANYNFWGPALDIFS